MTVSVLMPVYNAETYLQEAIDSILRQTFTDFELLILNDGSRDRTAEIASRAAAHDRRVVFVDRTDNWGLVRTLNDGIGRARGEFIARMDADDLALPEKFAKQVTFLRTHPEVGVVGTCFRYIGRDVVLNMPAEHDDIKLAALGYNPFGHPTVMIRASLLREHMYSEEFFLAEDYELWTRLLDRTRGANLSEVLLEYRIHPHQISSKSPKQESVADRVRLLQMLKIVPRASVTQQALHLKLMHHESLSFLGALRAHLWLQNLGRRAVAQGFASAASVSRFIRSQHAFRLYNGKYKAQMLAGYRFLRGALRGAR